MASESAASSLMSSLGTSDSVVVGAVEEEKVDSGATSNYTNDTAKVPVKEENSAVSEEKEENRADCDAELFPKAATSGGLLLCTYLGCASLRLNDRSQLCGHHNSMSADKGWRECKFEGCSKCRQGNTQFCKQHGGGRKCQVEGCTKLARGKTHCAAHGGGKRCAEAGCIRMAVGPTGKCIGHGGGKRCQYENCSRAAQYSWDFCARHAAEVRSQVKSQFKQLEDLASVALREENMVPLR